MNWEVRTMRSGTSCFNSTLYRKTMGRFWPLWVLYALMWALVIPINLLNTYFSVNSVVDLIEADREQWLREAAQSACGWVQPGVLIACCFGVLCAMAVFGYLYNNRSACMMHALPMRRETLFVTQYLAGLSFAVLPHLAVALLTTAVELVIIPSTSLGVCLTSLWQWAAGQSALALFFFSFAALCAMLTGHILALPAFYGIFNGLAMSLYVLVTELMRQFFFGYISGGPGATLVEYLTPVYALMEATRNIQGENGATYLEKPWMLGVYAAAGLVMAVIALLLYRRRHVETAGDVVAIPLVRPVFKYSVTFCVGLAFGIITAAFFGWHRDPVLLSVCVVLWSAAGYFAAEMLLKKSFRVLKAWGGCVASVAVMILLCALCFNDVFGVETRVPSQDRVVSVSVSSSMSYPYDEGQLNLDSMTDPDQIAEVIALHRAIVDDRWRSDMDGSGYEPGDDSFYVDITYTLDNGSTLRRSYNGIPLRKAELEQEGSITAAAQALTQDRELIELCYGFDRLEETGRMVEAYLRNIQLLDTMGMDAEGVWSQEDQYYLEGKDISGLWQAVRADFDAGNIGMRYLFDDQTRNENTYVTDLYFHWEIPGPRGSTSYNDLAVTLTPSARNTLQWLRDNTGLDTDYQLVQHQWQESSQEYYPDTQEVPDGVYYEDPTQEMAESAPVIF